MAGSIARSAPGILIRDFTAKVLGCLALLGALLTAGPLPEAQAQSNSGSLLGIQYNFSGGLATPGAALGSIDPTTGTVSTPIFQYRAFNLETIGIASYSALDSSNHHYFFTAEDPQGAIHLLEVDTQTGQLIANPVICSSAALSAGSCLPYVDLQFDGTSGTLLGVQYNFSATTPSAILGSIDPTTGSITTIVQYPGANPETTGGSGIASYSALDRSNHHYFFTAEDSQFNVHLVEADTQTGQLIANPVICSSAALLAGSCLPYVDLQFDETSGTLLGVQYNFSGPTSSVVLGAIDPATGSITPIFQNPGANLETAGIASYSALDSTNHHYFFTAEDLQGGIHIAEVNTQTGQLIANPVICSPTASFCLPYVDLQFDPGTASALATITAITGSGQIQRGTATLQATLGSTLQPGDTVTVGANSTAEITFNDGSKIEMGPNSSFVLALQGGTKIINQIIGFLQHIVHCLTNSGVCYQVITGNVAVSVRGTTFSTQFYQLGTVPVTTVIVQGGTVVVTPQSGSSVGPPVSVSAGTGVSVIGTTVVPPAIPLSAFSAKVEILSGNAFEINSAFTLGAGGSIAPLTQDLTFQIGTYSLTIPAGSFTRGPNGKFLFDGIINGVALQVNLTPLGTNSHSLIMEGKGAPNLPTTTSVTGVLIVYNNVGSTPVNVAFQ